MGWKKWWWLKEISKKEIFCEPPYGLVFVGTTFISTLPFLFLLFLDGFDKKGNKKSIRG